MGDEIPRPHLVVSFLAALALAAVIGVPAWFLVSRSLETHRKVSHKLESLACDDAYTVLYDDVGTRVRLEELERECGGDAEHRGVVECLLVAHAGARDPRDRRRPAYTTAPITPDDSCQVHVASVGTRGIRFSQYVRTTSTSSRTFSVTID